MKIDPETLKARQVHDLLTGAISPLPIALISTVGENGVNNAAPYSLTVPVSWKPPMVCVSIGFKKGEKKHTLRNLQFTRDFVINIMDEGYLKPTLRTSADHPVTVDKIKEVGLTAIASDKVKAPRIAEAQISIECRLVQELQFGKGDDLRSVVFGEVILVHVKDPVWVNGQIEPTLLRAVGRLGNGLYCRTGGVLKEDR